MLSAKYKLGTSLLSFHVADRSLVHPSMWANVSVRSYEWGLANMLDLCVQEQFIL